MKPAITLKALGLALVVAGTASAQLTTSGAAAAIDNIPPAPITNLVAADTPGEEGSSITLSWSTSIDDAVSFTRFGESVVPRGGVRGYNIYTKVGKAKTSCSLRSRRERAIMWMHPWRMALPTSIRHVRSTWTTKPISWSKLALQTI